MTRSEFITKAWAAASLVQKRGAAISVPIVVAQAALESNFGLSRLATEDNNLFGIKGEYRGMYSEYQTKEQLSDGTWATVSAKFRKYPTWRECFDDYASIIERLPWYQDAEDAANRPKDFLQGIVSLHRSDGTLLEPGWATDKGYYKKVWAIVEEYNLRGRQEELPRDAFRLLQIYDGGRTYTLEPLKHTVGILNDGSGMKLMIRVRPTTFWGRLRYLLGMS